MKVELALDMNQIQSLASRVAPAPVAKKAPVKKQQAPRPKKAAPKTAEELDAEMNVSASRDLTHV